MGKFKECQERGQIHGHGGYCPLVPGLSLREIQNAADGFVEEWMRSVMHFVQWTQFTCWDGGVIILGGGCALRKLLGGWALLRSPPPKNPYPPKQLPQGAFRIVY